MGSQGVQQMGRAAELSSRVSIILTGWRSGMQGFAVAVKMGVSKKMMDTVVGVHPSSAGNFHLSYTPRTPHNSVL